LVGKVKITMKKISLLFLLTAGIATQAVAQVPARETVQLLPENYEPARTTFMSYDNGENAVTFDVARSSFYVSLNRPWAFRLASGPQDVVPAGEPGVAGQWGEKGVPGYFAETSPADFEGLKPPALPAENSVGQYRTQVEIPVFWLDRDIFLRIEGLKGGLTLYVNGQRAGYAEQSGTPVEFNIAPYTTDGVNTIAMDITRYKTGDWLENGTINGAGIEGGVSLYSQYRIHINDFTVKTSFDSLKNTTGVADLAIELVNGFNFPDTVVVYYDLRDAQGKPVRYNTRETVVPGMGGRDTVRFQGKLADVKRWSPESPYLYQLVLRVRYKGRFIEYVPFRVGFRELKIENGVYTLNGMPIEIKGA
jgi:beta-galactosidase